MVPTHTNTGIFKLGQVIDATSHEEDVRPARPELLLLRRTPPPHPAGPGALRGPAGNDGRPGPAGGPDGGAAPAEPGPRPPDRPRGAPGREIRPRRIRMRTASLPFAVGTRGG